jgi:hypothetical protein
MYEDGHIYVDGHSLVPGSQMLNRGVFDTVSNYISCKARHDFLEDWRCQCWYSRSLPEQMSWMWCGTDAVHLSKPL